MNKRFFFLLVLLGVLLALSAVPRELVIVEIGTGTWCQYCPGAAMGADDLVNNNHPAAIVENHNGDTYANTYSNARNTYYGISSFPTAVFDGANPSAGGSNTNSMYSSYLPKVNARLAVPAHYTLSAAGANSGNNYIVIVNIAKPEADANTNVVLHSAITQSNITQSWQGQTHLNFVNRLMMPSQTGTPISLNTGDQTSVALNFTTQAAWPIANLELVIWLQNTTTKEILQGKKYALNALPTGQQVSTDMLQFPDTSVNATNLMPLTLTNFGSTVVTGTISSDNPPFTTDMTTFTLQPASATTVNVSFSPTTAQDYNGSLIINSNFPDNPAIVVLLSGTGFSNTSPTASNVSTSGVPVLYQTLTGTYNFSDPEGHIEGSTMLRWFRMVNGTPTLIAGANAANYQIAETDVGNTIAFEVTPVDYYGLAGTPAMSSPTPTIIPLPYPQNFTAVLNPPDNVVCTWEKPQYYDGRGFIGYRLYRDGLNIQTIPNPNTLTFTDTYVNNGTHEYWVCALFSDPSYLSPPSPIVVIVVGVANDEQIITPANRVLVHPNPFNKVASFEISTKANLTSYLEIYNLKGQLVRNMDIFTDNAGKAQLDWNGLTNNGTQALNGIYLYRFKGGKETISGKLMLLR